MVVVVVVTAVVAVVMVVVVAVIPVMVMLVFLWWANAFIGYCSSRPALLAASSSVACHIAIVTIVSSSLLS